VLEGKLVSECPLDSPLVERECPLVVKPVLSLKRRPHFKTCRRLGKNKNMIMVPEGT
jgi:hypothetical protein